MSKSKYTLVVIESPFAGDVKRNIAYTRMCMFDSLQRGEAPYASHLLYTQPGVLDDTIPEQRTMGIEAGLAFKDVCAKTVVYEDFGISKGMQMGIDRANENNQEVEYRRILNNGQDFKRLFELSNTEGF